MKAMFAGEIDSCQMKSDAASRAFLQKAGPTFLAKPIAVATSGSALSFPRYGTKQNAGLYTASRPGQATRPPGIKHLALMIRDDGGSECPRSN
jgi:hypothetical protein